MSLDTVVIVNPASAAGVTEHHWPEVRAALDDAGVDFEVRMTAFSGDATRLTREALGAGAQRVVAVGGDGTINEVVNGFFDEVAGDPISPTAILGLLPSGTGGDFRKTAGIPVHKPAAAALLARGDSRPIDVARIDYLDSAGRASAWRYFVNIADCGLGGEVVARVNQGPKRAGGRLTFLYHSLRAAIEFGRRPVRVEVDGTPIEGEMQNVVIANGRYFGGGMRIAPSAELDDGLLDVVLLSAGRVRSLLDIRRVYDGSHIGRPGCTWLRGRRIAVTPLDGAEFLFDVEGEQAGAAPATVTVLPGALRLCAPGVRSGTVR